LESLGGGPLESRCGPLESLGGEPLEPLGGGPLVSRGGIRESLGGDLDLRGSLRGDLGALESLGDLGFLGGDRDSL